MTDSTVRPLEPAEGRAAADLFRSTLHVKAATDEEWTRSQHALQPGRTLGAFGPEPVGPELFGVARSFDAELSVPGLRRVPMAAVTSVGVRADRTRRGVLTELMRAQLDDFAGRGVVAALLYASEGSIYGRFGYGVGTRCRSLTVDRRQARLRPEVPTGGEISLLGLESAIERLPGLYATLAHNRPAAMTRPPYWWAGAENQLRRSESPVLTAVHHGPGGEDGFAVYSVSRTGGGSTARSVLEVLDMHTGNPAAFAGLWRYLLSVDLVDEIVAATRSLDDPVELLFTDLRSCRVDLTDDETWLRLVDVPAVLAAREFQGEPLVLEVTDPFLPRNSGRYRVSESGAARTDERADLTLGVDSLAMLYFGAWRASALAAVGRVQAASPEVLATADQLFATRSAAWCGTFF